MAELYDQDAVSADGYDPAADAGTETDTSPRPVDENGQESWTEDAEPLTRDEYAEQVRQSEATSVHDSTDCDPDDTHDQADTDDGQEKEELPEPRTRQEVADQDSRAGTDTTDHDQAADAAIDAGTAEEDNLPEPRTRQEVAEEARSGADPLAHPGSDTQHERDTGDWPSPEERARLHDAYLDWRNETTSSGREQGTNVIGEKPDRSPGDRSDLPPTGEQIVEMEDPKASRAERARKEFLSEENLGDAFDATDEWAKTGQDLFTRPPTSQHIEVPAQGPEITAAPQQEIDPGSAATAGLVLGILGAEFFRWGKHKVEHMRGRHRASDR
jgi:hypothetical protein